MKIYLTQSASKITYDISEIVSTVSWSGSMDQACRTVEFSVLNAPNDPNVASFPSVTMGDFVQLLDDEEGSIFVGMVYTSERTSDIGDISYTAYDMLYHFMKSSWSKNFQNTTPEKVALACCQEVGVNPGAIVPTNISIGKLLIDNKTIYDTLILAL